MLNLHEQKLKKLQAEKDRIQTEIEAVEKDYEAEQKRELDLMSGIKDQIVELTKRYNKEAELKKLPSRLAVIHSDGQPTYDGDVTADYLAKPSTYGGFWFPSTQTC